MIAKEHRLKLLIGMTGLTLFLVLKTWHSWTDVEGVSFLVWPSTQLIASFSGMTFEYQEGIGYFFREWNILVDKSCSGFNWWMLAFLLGTFTSLQHLPKAKLNGLVLPILLIITYCLTILVNTTRILIACLIEPQLAESFSSIHLWEGVIVYLSFLMLWQLFCIQVLKKYNSNYASLT